MDVRITNTWKYEFIWLYKKTNSKIKSGENVPSLEVVEVVLFQCVLIDNHYQHKSKILCTFTSSTYLLNVEPSNLVFLKIYNIEFDEIIITFTDQNGRLLEIGDKVNLALIFNK